MTIPKWLLPVIAGVAILAVGVAAFLVGGQFATTTAKQADVGTTTLPVVEPVGYGEDAPVAQLPDGSFNVSPATGTEEVPNGLPPAPGVTPIVDAVNTDAGGHAPADDLADTVSEEPPAGTPSGPIPYIPLIDPCISGIGDCPDGTIMSHIYADTAPPPMTIRVVPFSDSPICPARSGPGQVAVLTLVSRPANIVVTMEPTVQQGARRVTRTEEHPDPDLITAWQNAVAHDVPADELPPLYLCTYYGLGGGDDYRLYAGATADDDGSFVSTGAYINPAGPAQPPTLTVHPVGNSAAVVYSERKEDQVLEMKGYVAVPGTSPTCEELEDAREIPSSYSATSTLTQQQLLSQRIEADYSQRVAFGFRVPEGSTVLFCGRWFEGSSHPSWDRDQAVRNDGAYLVTPDYILPRVTLTAVNLTATGVTSGRVTARTFEGSPCGFAILAPDPTTLAARICQLDAGSTSFSSADNAFTDVGFSGDIVVRSSLTLEGQGQVTGETVLDTGRDLCVGNCSIPGPAWYTVPLPQIANGEALCGSTFGECTPVTPTTSAGMMTIRVDWIQGNSNGESEPQVLDVPTRGHEVSTAGGGPLPRVEPQFDTDNQLSYSGVAPGTFSAIVGIDVHADRPVDYQVTLRGLHDSDPCTIGGAHLVASGHADDVIRVEIPGACFGSYYAATIVLTDAAGETSTWGYTQPGHYQWHGSILIVPKLQVTLHYTVQKTVPAGSAIYLSDLELDSQAISPVSDTGSCADGSIHGSGDITVRLTSTPQLKALFKVGPSLDQMTPTDCIASPDATPVVDGTVALNLGQMLANPGATTVTVGGMTISLLPILP